MYRKWGKRLFDLLLTIPALIVLSPVLLVVALLVRWKHGAPVLFAQQRPGLHGEPFMIYKFRTMTSERDKNGKLLPESQRITGLGNILRKSSLDELPELYNVIRGEMSLVGPRPLRMRYLERYNPEQARRHEVKPGITGWAQINGRNGLSWEEKFELDVWYVDHMKYALDLTILWNTIWKVLNREDINASEQVPMPEFRGTQMTNDDARNTL